MNRLLIATGIFTAIFGLSSLAAAPSTHDQDLLSKIAPPRPKGADSFDFLIGSWSCRFEILEPDGSITKGLCGWEGRQAAGGHAIIDEYWHVASIGKSTVLGVNIRTFDGGTGKWTNKWYDALTHRWLEFEATSTEFGIEAIYDSEDSLGPHLIRFRFFEIKPNSFEWRMDRSRDEGATWKEGVMRIWVTRRNPGTDLPPI